MKTEVQIERDFYHLIKGSALGKEVKGGIYRSEMRPYNSEAEDMVIKFLSGIDGQIQTGVVILNLYVPDAVLDDGRKVADKMRIDTLQSLIASFVEDAGDVEYLIETDGTPTTMKNEEIDQHFIYVRLKFHRLNQ